MKTKHLIVCAALATIVVGCTSEDVGQNSNGKTFIATVRYNQDDNVTTRAAAAAVSYDKEGDDIPVVGFNSRWFSDKDTTSEAKTRMSTAGLNSNGNMSYTWDTSDKMGLLYTLNGANTVDYLENQSGAKSRADFSRNVTFDSSLDGTSVAFTMFYPYRSLNNGGIYHFLKADQSDGMSWSAQTMASINSSESKTVTSGSTITLGEGMDFVHHMVYVKFVLGCGSQSSPYYGKSVKAVTLYTDYQDGQDIAPGIKTLAGGIEWDDVAAGTTADASLASLWTNAYYGPLSFPHKAALTSASAFQNTVKNDFTSKTDATNLIYTTACSVKGSMLVLRPDLSYKANQLRVKVELTDGTILYRMWPEAITFTTGHLKIMKLNLDNFSKYSVTYETEDIKKGTVTCPLKGANVTTQDLLPSGFGFIANTNSTNSSDNVANVKATGNTGFVFTGWECSTDGGLNWSSTSDGNPFNSSVSNDNGKIYRAKFSGGHTLTYHSNYGQDLTKSESRITGSYTELTDNTFTRDGYNFLGWSESNTATTATYGNKVKYTMPDADANLYAVWKAVDHGTVNTGADGKYYVWDELYQGGSGYLGYKTFDEDQHSYLIQTGTATHLCKDCPTIEQYEMYLAAGVYWGNGPVGSAYENQPGLWMMKKQYISNFDTGTAAKVSELYMYSSQFYTGRPGDPGKYFFLPALNRHVDKDILHKQCWYWTKNIERADVSGNGSWEGYISRYNHMIAAASGVCISGSNYPDLDGFCIWKVD